MTRGDDPKTGPSFVQSAPLALSCRTPLVCAPAAPCLIVWGPQTFGAHRLSSWRSERPRPPPPGGDAVDSLRGDASLYTAARRARACCVVGCVRRALSMCDVSASAAADHIRHRRHTHTPPPPRRRFADTYRRYHSHHNIHRHQHHLRCHSTRPSSATSCTSPRSPRGTSLRSRTTSSRATPVPRRCRSSW
jgi:hypothetical protein